MGAHDPAPESAPPPRARPAGGSDLHSTARVGQGAEGSWEAPLLFSELADPHPGVVEAEGDQPQLQECPPTAASRALPEALCLPQVSARVFTSDTRPASFLRAALA